MQRALTTGIGVFQVGYKLSTLSLINKVVHVCRKKKDSFLCAPDAQTYKLCGSLREVSSFPLSPPPVRAASWLLPRMVYSYSGVAAAAALLSPDAAAGGPLPPPPQPAPVPVSPSFSCLRSSSSTTSVSSPGLPVPVSRPEGARLPKMAAGAAAGSSEWLVLRDGCLRCDEHGVSSLTYHPALNAILAVTARGSIKIIDGTSGAILQASAIHGKSGDRSCVCADLTPLTLAPLCVTYSAHLLKGGGLMLTGTAN